MWPTYYTWIPMGVWGIPPPENVWNLNPVNAISCILSIQICSKTYANYTCIWNKRRKKCTKVTCVGAYSAPPHPPACMLKKALDFVCAFINKWVWLCKGCFSRRLTEMTRNAKTKTKNINAQCFYNLHNLCHNPSSFIYRCSSYMAKHIKSN
jgi:hypothetical protein